MEQVNQLRLSFSSLEQLNSCERKFQLEKLLSNPKREDSVHLWFGRAFGAGVAEYLSTGSKDRALFVAWMEYDSSLEKDRKSKYSCIYYLLQSFSHLETLLQTFEVPEFHGKPAVELSFRLNINAEKYFVGHIDVVLRHKVTGIYYVLEVKTTSSRLLDLDPEYRHSVQTVGYSTALDAIVGKKLSSYGVVYFVCQMPQWNAVENIAKFHTMPYIKTLTDRLEWFVQLGMDVQRIEQMEQLNIFPRRSKSCTAYGRVCPHFGTCHLKNYDIPAPFEPDEIQYQYTFDLEEIIADHIERISNLPVQQQIGEPLRTHSQNAGLVSID